MESELHCPAQLKGTDSAFKGLPHTLKCKQVNPKYLQSLLDPTQELITGFAVWSEVFKSAAEGGRKGGMDLLLLLSWALWKKACRNASLLQGTGKAGKQ